MGNGLFSDSDPPESPNTLGDTTKWFWKVDQLISCWVHQDNDSKWYLYDAETSKMLEDSFVANPTGTLYLNHGIFARVHLKQQSTLQPANITEFVWLHYQLCSHDTDQQQHKHCQRG